MNVHLNATELAILRQLPGDTDAARLRSALMRGAIMDELREAVRQEVHAATKAQATLVRDTQHDLLDALKDMEREIMSALRDLPTPDEKVAKKIAGSLSRVIAHGIMPQVDMGRKEPLRKEIAALAHASGELDE